MTELEKLIISIEIQNKQVAKAVNQVNKQVSGIQNVVGKTTSKMGASFMKFGKLLLGVFAIKQLDNFIQRLIQINDKADQFKVTIESAFQNISNTLTTTLEAIVRGFTIAFNFIAGLIQGIQGEFKGIVGGAKKAAAGVKKAFAGFDEVNVIPSQDAATGPANLFTDAEITNQIKAGYDWWVKWKDIILVIGGILAGGLIAGAILKMIGLVGTLITGASLLGPLLGIFSHFVESGSLLGNIFAWIQGLLARMYELFILVFKGTTVLAEGTIAAAAAPVVFILAIIATLAALWQAWKENLFGIRDEWIAVWGNIVKYFETVWKWIKVYIDIAILILMTIWTLALKPLWDRFVEFVAAVAVFVGKIINLLMPIINFLTGVFAPIFAVVFAILGALFVGAITVVSWFVGKIFEGLTVIISIFNDVLDFIKFVFTGQWDKAFNSLVSIVSKIVEPMVKPFRTAFNFIADLWNKTIGGFKVDFLGVKFTVPTMPKWTAAIPQLADGGSLNAGSLFVAGEAGAELIGNYGGRTTVMPLENSDFTQAMKQAVMEGIREGAGSGSTTLEVDGMVLAKAVEKNLNKLSTVQGGLNLGL